MNIERIKPDFSNLKVTTKEAERVVDALRKGFESRHPYFTWEPFQKQAEVILSPAHIKGLVGANRVGKTETAAETAVSYCIGVDPVLTRLTGELIVRPTPAHVWCVSLDSNLSRDVLEPKVAHFIPESELLPGRAGYSVQNKIYRFKNGSTLGFKSCDSGERKFSGTERNLIVFDEEPPFEVYKECLMRILTVSGDMLFSFTPLEGSEWLHDLLFSPGHLGLAKLGVFHREIGMRDNPYIPQQMIDAAESFYTGKERDIRVHGIYHVMSMGKFFDWEKLAWQKKHRRPVLIEGKLARDGNTGVVKMTPDAFNNPMRVFCFPDLEESYACGIDVADGNPLGDYSVIQVLQVSTMEQVASWRGRIGPVELGYLARDIGEYYNNAMLAVESNRAGPATIHTIRSTLYPFIFAMPAHLKTRVTSSGQKSGGSNAEFSARAPQWGWNTNQRTKPIAANSLKNHIIHGTIRINDDITIDELQKYAHLRKDADSHKYGLGCPTGHDDTVAALMIACQAAEQETIPGRSRRNPFKKKTLDDILFGELLGKGSVDNELLRDMM